MHGGGSRHTGAEPVGQDIGRRAEAPAATPQAAARKSRLDDTAELGLLLADTPQARAALAVFGAQLRAGALRRSEAREATADAEARDADRLPEAPAIMQDATRPKRRLSETADLDRLLSDTHEARVALTVFGARLRAGALRRSEAREAIADAEARDAARVPETPAVMQDAARPKRRLSETADLDRLLADTSAARVTLTVFGAQLRAGGARRAEASQDASAEAGQGADRAPDAPAAAPRAARKLRPDYIAELDRLLADTPAARAASVMFGAQLRAGAEPRVEALKGAFADVEQEVDRAPDAPAAAARAARQRRPDGVAELDLLLADTPAARVALKVFGAQLRAGGVRHANDRNAPVAGSGADRAAVASLASPEAARPRLRAGGEAEPFEVGSPPPMPLTRPHEDDMPPGGTAQLSTISTEAAEPPRPGRSDGKLIISVGPRFASGDGDRPFGPEPVTLSPPQQPSDAPAGHTVPRAGDGDDEQDRPPAPPQGAGPASASASAASMEAALPEPRPMPTGSSPRDLAMAYIERLRAAAEPAVLDFPIVVEAVVPIVSMERATASRSPRVTAESLGEDTTSGKPTTVEASPRPAVAETDRSKAAPSPTAQAIDGRERGALTSSGPAAASLSPPRTSAPRLPPAPGVGRPASPAQADRALSPSVPGSDRISVSPSLLPGLPPSPIPPSSSPRPVPSAGADVSASPASGPTVPLASSPARAVAARGSWDAPAAGKRPARDGVEPRDMKDIEVVENIEDVLAAIEARATLPSLPRAPIPTVRQPAPAHASIGGSAQTRAGDGDGDTGGVPHFGAATVGRAADPIFVDDWGDIELPDADAADLDLAPTDAGPPSAPPAKEVDGGRIASPRSFGRSALGVLRGAADWLNGVSPDTPAVRTELPDGPAAIPVEDLPARASASKPTQVAPTGGPVKSSAVSSTISTPRPPISPAAPTGPAVVPDLPGNVVRPAVPTFALPSDDAIAPRPAPERGGGASPSAVPPNPGPLASSRVAKAWHPGLLPSDKRALAGLFARHLVEQAGRRSHAARLASIRAALGADADELEKWTRARMNGVRLGSPDAQPFLQRLVDLAAPLKGRDDKETTGKENEEIRRHGGTPVPVRPPWDPREAAVADRFLAASFLTARSNGDADLEKAVVLAYAKRHEQTFAWSGHAMERVWVWAGGDASGARSFRGAQPRQDRLSGCPATDWGQWLRTLQHEYRSATGKDLFDGSRGVTD